MGLHAHAANQHRDHSAQDRRAARGEHQHRQELHAAAGRGDGRPRRVELPVTWPTRRGSRSSRLPGGPSRTPEHGLTLAGGSGFGTRDSGLDAGYATGRTLEPSPHERQWTKRFGGAESGRGDEVGPRPSAGLVSPKMRFSGLLTGTHGDAQQRRFGRRLRTFSVTKPAALRRPSATAGCSPAACGRPRSRRC